VLPNCAPAFSPHGVLGLSNDMIAVGWVMDILPIVVECGH
jgi:hypothetical protein